MLLHRKGADNPSLIRKIAHMFNDHGGSSMRVLTGRIPNTPTDTVNDSPAVCTKIAKMRAQYKLGLPNGMSLACGGRAAVITTP